MEVKGGGILRSRVNIKLPSGKHEAMPVLNPLDESDLIAYALKNSKYFLKYNSNIKHANMIKKQTIDCYFRL